MSPSAVKIAVTAAAVVLGILLIRPSDRPPAEAAAPAVSSAARPGEADQDTESEAVIAVGTKIHRVERNQEDLRETAEQLQKSMAALDAKVAGLAAWVEQSAAARQGSDDNTKVADFAADRSQARPDLGRDAYLEIPAPDEAPREAGIPASLRWKWFAADLAPLGGQLEAAPVLTEPRLLAGNTPSDRVSLVLPSGSLVEARTLTGVIGRIPIGGRVSDPWPFKLIADGHALTANYKELDVDGMIFEGVAQGDYAFRCARGQINKVTTVLPDNSVTTVTSESNEGGIGWISDGSSNPCLPGQLISNQDQVLAGRLLFSAASGAARALAQAEETRTVSADGVERTTVSGDGLRAAGARALAGAADSAQTAFNRRSDVWDAVFVEAGQNVLVHITDDLVFKHNPDRKLYDKTILNGGSAHSSDAQLD